MSNRRAGQRYTILIYIIQQKSGIVKPFSHFFRAQRLFFEVTKIALPD